MTEEEKLSAIAPANAKSLPERMLYGWLVKHGVAFGYQTSVAGGRLPGGAVLDFVIYERVVPIAIRLQSYWHKGAENVLADDIQLNMLQETGYVVEDIWDYELQTAEEIDRKMREVIYGAPKFREVL